MKGVVIGFINHYNIFLVIKDFMNDGGFENMANSKKISEITKVESLANSDILIADTQNGTRAYFI